MHLPEELLLEILPRLPAKSVGKFRCVSIQWRTLLYTHEFIEKHLNRSRTLKNQEHLILISYLDKYKTLFVTIPPKGEPFSEKLDLLRGDWSQFVGSCNGLVLLSDQIEDMLLVNPITQQQVKLPSNPLAFETNKNFEISGFGYDSSSQDYKIVTLSRYYFVDSHKLNKPDWYVDLYSLKSGVWKRLGSSPYTYSVYHIDSGTFVNGVLHWLAYCQKSGHRHVIAAFDLVNEVFSEIPAPRSVDKDRIVFNKLAVLDGCLCMMDIQEYDSVDLWRMKEYGLEESWVKFSFIGNCEWEIVKPFYFVGEKELVLRTEEEDRLVLYDGRVGTYKNMIVDGVEADFPDGGVFMESLVSPDLREDPLRIE